MLDNSASQLPIKEDDLAHYSKRATDFLKSVMWEPRRDVAALQKDLTPKGPQPQGLRRLETLPSRQTLSLLEVAKSIGHSDELMDENVNNVLNVTRQGLRIALHVAALYAKTSGLESLRERNQKKQMTSDAEQAEFRDKSETQAAITVFALAYHIVWKLQQQPTDVSETSLSFSGIPESIALYAQTAAIQCVLFHFGSYLKDGGVLTGLDARKMAQLYFTAVLEEMKGRAGALKYAEPYVERSYRLERTNFSLNGFHGDAFSRTLVEFKRVEMGAIVGNADAKLHAYRMAQALIAYDFDEKKNPMVELGGFPSVYLMKGIPGTGKTLLIAAILTMVDDYCKALELPFLGHPLPNAIVSTFQGGSAENMENWMLPLSDPKTLFIAPIDDAENSFQDRTMQGVSSGVREIIGVFLRRTEGASAINRGNSIITFATNIPEQMDKAVLSRVLARMDVNGAQSREDFLDQMELWAKGYQQYREGFMDLEFPADYVHLSAQKLRSAAERLADGVIEVRDEKLALILEKVGTQYKPHQHDFYAALFTELKYAYPFFSSRDVRNIQVAAGTRLLDFDFPKEWLTERKHFVDHPYGAKRDMIIELIRSNMGGLEFHELVHQETIKYLDTMVSILDASHKRRVEELVQEMAARQEAGEQFKRKTGVIQK